jgi:hypothetical protein
MCWSFEVSAITGLVSYSIAFYIWKRNFGNDRWNSIILFTFSSIQWMDAIIWYFDKKKRLDSNVVSLVSNFLIPIILALEPVASLYGAYYTNKSVSQFDTVLYGVVFLVVLWSLLKNVPGQGLIQNHSIKYNKTEHGMWSYWLFYFFIIYPFLKYTQWNPLYVITAIMIAITLLLAQTKINTIGSNWCLYSNVIAIIFLFYPYLETQLSGQ